MLASLEPGDVGIIEFEMCRISYYNRQHSIDKIHKYAYLHSKSVSKCGHTVAMCVCDAFTYVANYVGNHYDLLHAAS